MAPRCVVCHACSRVQVDQQCQLLSKLDVSTAANQAKTSEKDPSALATTTEADLDASLQQTAALMSPIKNDLDTGSFFT